MAGKRTSIFLTYEDPIVIEAGMMMPETTISKDQGLGMLSSARIVGIPAEEEVSHAHSIQDQD